MQSLFFQSNSLKLKIENKEESCNTYNNSNSTFDNSYMTKLSEESPEEY